jgi:histidinol phosphatase-like enzyme
VDLTHSLAIGDKLTDLTPAAELGVNHLYLLDPQSNIQRDIGYKYTSAKSWVELVNIIKHINSDMGEY